MQKDPNNAFSLRRGTNSYLTQSVKSKNKLCPMNFNLAKQQSSMTVYSERGNHSTQIYCTHTQTWCTCMPAYICRCAYANREWGMLLQLQSSPCETSRIKSCSRLRKKCMNCKNMNGRNW